MCGKNKIAIVQWPLSYTGALLLKAFFLVLYVVAGLFALGVRKPEFTFHKHFRVSAHETIEIKSGALWLWALLFKMLNSTVQ